MVMLKNPGLPSAQPRASKALALIAVVGLGVLPACGEEKQGGGGKPATLPVEVAGSGKDASIEAPKSVPGGLVEVQLKNSGKKPHDAQLIRIDGDHTIEEALRTIERSQEGGPLPPWLHAAGGVATTPPGASRSSTQALPAGNYYLVDTEATEGFSDAPTAELKVEGGEAGAQPPSAPASITARDYSFTTSGLKAGKNAITFENTGKEPHHVVVAPLKPGKTLDDVRKFAREEKGPPPIDEKSTQSTTVLDGGTKQVTELELKKPGKYALLCFITDRAGGPPHVEKGMAAEATIR